MKTIDKLIRLNLEMEGLLRVIDGRDDLKASTTLLQLLAEKHTEYGTLLAQLTPDSEPATEPEAPVIDIFNPTMVPAEEEFLALDEEDKADAEKKEQESDNDTQPIATSDKDKKEEPSLFSIDDEDIFSIDDEPKAPEAAPAGAKHAEEEEDTLIDFDDVDVVEMAPTEIGDFETVVIDNEPTAKPEPALATEDFDTVVITDTDVKQPSKPAHTSAPVETKPTSKADTDKPKQPQAPAYTDEIPSHLRVDEFYSRRNSQNLSQAFTLNDKFRFRRELFGNSDADMNDVLDTIAAMKTFDEATDYLYNDLGWDPENEEVKDFMYVIANHFNAD